MSNSEVIAEIKKEDKKPKVIFYLILAVSVVIGLISGYLSAVVGDSEAINNWINSGMDMVNQASVYIGFITSVIVAIWTLVLYHKSRKEYDAWDEEDDEAMDRIETKLSLALIVTNGNLIITYIFSVVAMAQIPNFFEDPATTVLKFAFFFGGLILSMVVAMVASVKIVNFEKLMNPEKKGSAYDFNFQKKWLESSDEAEKLVNYKSAFASYKAVNIVCMLLWLLCMYGMTIWQWDNVPVFMVGTIWLTSYFSYSIESLKLSKHASKIQE